MKRQRNNPGFTLIELMVSVLILAIMVLIVNEVLSGAMAAVRRAQNQIRLLAGARVAADRLRDDIVSIAQDGLLVVVNYNRQSGLPIDTDWPAGASPGLGYDSLGFMTASPFVSIASWVSMANDPPRGNAKFIDYGGLPIFGQAPSGRALTDTGVFRRIMGLSVVNSGSYYQPGWDYYSPGLAGYAELRNWNRALALDDGTQLTFTKNWQPATAVYTHYPSILAPPGTAQSAYPPDPPPAGQTQVPLYVVLPPQSTTGVERCWPLLATNCVNFTVEWTDGGTESDQSCRWYGSARPRDTLRTWQYQDQNPGQDAPEFALPNTNAAYCAMWTWKKPDNWPRALRIRFTLAVGDARQEFEVVADLVR